MDFKKIKSLFVGIDSDGTVFDSMTIKHTHSFIPASIKVFGLQSCAKEFTEIAEKVNLYSPSRGINRFPGQYLAFEELQEKGLHKFEGLENFKAYIDSGAPFSNSGLEEYLKANPSKFNQKVLEWSRLGDEYFEKLTQNIPPFEGVKSAVKKMSGKADIMVVSAASSKGLIKDWTNAGLTASVDFIAGQEFGNKAAQLLYAKERGYNETQMLMIGDAPGDYDAAKKAGARYYPIIPGNESESWRLLESKYFDMFANGCYTAEIENSLYKKFKEFLEGKGL